MTQHTSKLCKGYLNKKESDGVLHQLTWHPQSPNLNPIEKVWDELDLREKTLGKALQVKLVVRMPRVCKAVIKEKGGYIEESKITYFDLFNTFLDTTLFHVCYFIVLMSSL